MKTVGFCPVSIADMNSACKKYPSKCIIIEFPYEGTISANFIKDYILAIQPIFSKI